jgi:hypothetical protein
MAECTNCNKRVSFVQGVNEVTHRQHTVAVHGSRRGMNANLLSRRHKKRLLDALAAECKAEQRKAARASKKAA